MQTRTLYQAKQIVATIVTTGEVSGDLNNDFCCVGRRNNGESVIVLKYCLVLGIRFEGHED